ncbi:hypothetical protein [Nocardia higoensis]|uniref:hypothetical protein n=1 Tax=Nocardia higoensis TaxID=228599 RepID=UPI0002D2CD7F|nr:hypothetical protein [Nocardia higoensis]
MPVGPVLVGVGRELHYHFPRQFRWEKNRPTLFGLSTVVDEGALILVLVGNTTLVLNGPMRAVFRLRRLRDGRLR